MISSHFRIEARTDTSVCCICLEDFNFLRDTRSLFPGYCRNELKYGELKMKPTTSKGHTESEREDVTAKSFQGFCEDSHGRYTCVDDGFRNRRSFTINSRDDVKGVHQLSNKTKLSITMETTNNDIFQGSKKENDKQQKCPVIKKYQPDDIYSRVFEQQVENNSNDTVIHMETNSEEVSTNSYVQLRNSRNGYHSDIYRDTNVMSSVVENYYHPEMMLYDDTTLVNIPGSVNIDSSSTTTSSETDCDNDDSDDQRQHKLQGPDLLGLLPCGHAFHFECIFEWLKKSKNCPTCRQNGTLYNVKVVKKDAFQKYMHLSRLKDTQSNVLDSDAKNRRKIVKTCYRRSISAL